MISLAAPPVPSLATVFRGLADAARLACLLTLRDRPCTVGEVVLATGLSQPNVSKHLACLRGCGLVTSERSGRFVYYRLADDGVTALVQMAEALLDRVGPPTAVEGT